MPEKATKKSVEPSKGFLSRIFGTEEFTPEMKQGIEIARKEMPDMAPVEPFGFFSRLMHPKAQGWTSFGNTIYLNPKTTSGYGYGPQDIADVLVHEQEHVRQNKAIGPTKHFLNLMFGPSLPYGQRPDELAAFQAEKNRRYAMGRPPFLMPSFTNPGQYIIPPSDINLPNPNKFQPKY